MMRLTILICAVFPLLSGCGEAEDDRSFVERAGLTSPQAPNEFAILPQKPLELPEDLAALPTPKPGTVSRTDLTPELDVLVALSGRPARAAATRSDVAILNATGVGGADPQIRTTLASEDSTYRGRNRGRLLERLFGKSNDLSVYRRVTLDAEAELLRLRALGLRVPPLPDQ